MTNSNKKTMPISDEGRLGFIPKTLPILLQVDKQIGALERALERLCRKASEAIEDGCDMIILSDHGVGPGYAPIPSLLAVSAVHHHLIRAGARTSVPPAVETRQAREVHPFPCLPGYGGR